MKISINCILTLFLPFAPAIAQKNNPQNKVGIDFVTSYNIIKNDADSIEIPVLNQETLDRYNAVTAIKSTLTIIEASQILQEIKNATLSNVLNEAKLATFSKEAISRAMAGADIFWIVKNVKSRPLATDEKRIVLAILAIIYHGNASPSLYGGSKDDLYYAVLSGITAGALYGPSKVLAAAAFVGIAREATP